MFYQKTITYFDFEGMVYSSLGWLLFHIGKITNDLNILGGVGYEYEIMPQYQKWIYPDKVDGKLSYL